MVWDTKREAFEAAGVLGELTTRHYWCAPATTTGIDASVAYTAATTITITSLGWTFKRDNIVMILQIPVSTGTGTVIQHTDRSLWTVAGAVIAVEDAAFVNTDTFQVVLVGADRAETALGAISTDTGNIATNTGTTATNTGTTATNTGNIATSTGTTATNTGTTATNTGTTATNTGTSAGYLASIVQAFVAAITALRVYITNWPQPASGEAALELTGLAAATTRYAFDLADSGYLSYSANVHTVANVTYSCWYTNDAAATTAADSGWEQDDDLGDQTTAIGWFRTNEAWARMMIKVISTGAGTIDCHITRAP